MYWRDFEQIAKVAGFSDPRLVNVREIHVTDPGVAAKVGSIRFFSATYRLFRLTGLECGREDYGHEIWYRGTIPHYSDVFHLDADAHLTTGVPLPVCANACSILIETRYAPHFESVGDGVTHRGVFGRAEPGLSGHVDSIEGGKACC